MTLGRSKVAIVGFCETSRDLTPYEDPEFEIWGLNRGYIFMLRADRWFEMHSPAIVADQIRRPGKHTEWLAGFGGPVYRHRADLDLPNVVAYPLLEVAADIGEHVYRIAALGAEQTSTTTAPYLTSSIALELALAIHEGFREIHLYGVDLNTGGEYTWQKSGVEFLLGLAAGRGIRVVLPANCPLLDGGIYGRGYLKDEGETVTRTQYETRLRDLQQEQGILTKQINEIEGAARECEALLAQLYPGVDHEQLEQRHQHMQILLVELRAKHQQNGGQMKELLYWIGQTPAGQDPAEAVAQLQPVDADGPVTAFDTLAHDFASGTPALIAA